MTFQILEKAPHERRTTVVVIRKARDRRPPAPPVASSEGLRSSADLLGADGILHIEHEGGVYTLRRTRNGRLILTK
jgi:hemin uptake protein HemP